MYGAEYGTVVSVRLTKEQLSKLKAFTELAKGPYSWREPKTSDLVRAALNVAFAHAPKKPAKVKKK